MSDKDAARGVSTVAGVEGPGVQNSSLRKTLLPRSRYEHVCAHMCGQVWACVCGLLILRHGVLGPDTPAWNPGSSPHQLPGHMPGALPPLSLCTRCSLAQNAVPWDSRTACTPDFSWPRLTVTSSTGLSLRAWPWVLSATVLCSLLSTSHSESARSVFTAYRLGLCPPAPRQL